MNLLDDRDVILVGVDHGWWHATRLLLAFVGRRAVVRNKQRGWEALSNVLDHPSESRPFALSTTPRAFPVLRQTPQLA